MSQRDGGYARATRAYERAGAAGPPERESAGDACALTRDQSGDPGRPVLSRAELVSGHLSTRMPSRAAARREAEARALEDYLVACRAHDAQSVRRLLEGEHGGEVSA